MLDRDVSVGGEPVARLAAVEESGRLVLVSFVDGRESSDLTAAAERLARARRSGPAIARHLGSGRLRTELDPLAVLVAPAFEAEFVERFAALAPENVWLAELRDVESRSGGARTQLTRVAPRDPARAVGPAGATGAGFVEQLAPEVRDLGVTLVKRVARLDANLVASSSAGSVRWTIGGQAFCAAHAVGGELRVDAAGLERSPRKVATREELESCLDALVGLRLAASLSAPLGAEPGTPAHALVSPALTAEEIAAFREPAA